MIPWILKKIVPLPKLDSYNTFLFVGPHPDDIEIACGGTVSKLVRMNKKVYFAIVTDGGAGSSNPKADINELIATRLSELQSSASFLKVEDVFTCGFPDGGEYSVTEVAKELTKIILDVNPDVIIGPDPSQPSEIHLDHIKTGLAMNQAALMTAYPLMAKRNQIEVKEELFSHFQARSLAYYYTHRANQIVKLTQKDIVNRKQSILLHQSQFPTEAELKPIEQYLKIRGLSFRLNTKAEGFFIMAPIHQHCFPEINRY